MTKPFRPSAVTANALRSGAVVFRTPAGTWSPDVAAAEVARSEADAAALLARAQADQDSCLVVEPVLIDVAVENGAVRPLARRERIRAEGPTVAYGTAGRA